MSSFTYPIFILQFSVSQFSSRPLFYRLIQYGSFHQNFSPHQPSHIWSAVCSFYFSSYSAMSKGADVGQFRSTSDKAGDGGSEMGAGDKEGEAENPPVIASGDTGGGSSSSSASDEGTGDSCIKNMIQYN